MKTMRIAAWLIVIFLFLNLSPPVFSETSSFSSATAEDSSALLSKESIENGWYFQTGEIQVKVTAVTDRIFRIRAVSRLADWPAEKGTFIAPRNRVSPLLKRFDTSEEFGVSTDSGAIGILKNSLEIYLRGTDIVKIEKCRLELQTEDNPRWEVTFPSAQGERNYGIGNPEMGKSGGLMKAFAQTTVGNGVTQVPFVWSTAGYGILVDFEEKGAEWKKAVGIHRWRVPGEVLDLYFLLGDTPYQILNAYTDLTGKPPIPPIWAFGFMMSRWGYGGWEDIRQKWHTFRQKEIPVDVFIYDYDWFVKDWQWNNKSFPDPKENVNEALKMGIKVVGIRKPRVEDEEHFKFAKSRNWILADSKNDLNFSIPEVRDWWWKKHVPVFRDGMAGWWNDEAEQTITEYFYMVKSQWDGMQAVAPGKRVWTINRAFSPGLQRLGAAVWTGDINSSWEALQNQPGTLLNYSMAGMAYGSQDIGGFIGLPSPEMYVRWIQEGVFVPVMRAHSQQYSDRWPWAFGLEAEKAVKKAIELRYRLIPYLYSYAWQANQTGAPLMRPLFFEFPDDPLTFNMEDEFLVGREILAAPVLNSGGERKVYLPDGNWYDFASSKLIEGPAVLSVRAQLDEIPIFVREGSILPLGPVVQHTGEKTVIPLDIHVYPGKDASFLLYQDDAETYAYEKGQYRQILLRWKQAGCSLLIEPIKKTYEGPRRYAVNNVYFHNVDKPTKVVLNGKSLAELKDGLSKKTGWFYASADGELTIVTTVIDLSNKILIELGPEANRPLSSVDRQTRIVPQLSLEILASQGDKEAIGALIQKLPKEDLYGKTRIINALAPRCNQDEVFGEFKKMLRISDPSVKDAILKAIKGYSPKEDYFGLIVPLAFDSNGKIASLAREILNLYPESKSGRYFGQPIKQWKVIGPFDNKGGKGFANAYSPEKEINLNALKNWKTALADNSGVVNLLRIFPEVKEDVCAYGLVVIESKEEMEVQLWMGSDDDLKVWLNGENVWSKKIGRALKRDEDKVKVELKKGSNLLLLKVCQGMGAWEFVVRFVDPNGRLDEISQ